MGCFFGQRCRYNKKLKKKRRPFMRSKANTEIIDLLAKELNGKNLTLTDVLNSKEGLNLISEKILNEIMESQRDEYIMENPDYRNGYYSRSMHTASGKLNLQVPRTRENNFFPSLLTKYQRSSNSYLELVANLIYNGRSKENIKSVLKDFELHFSKEVAETLFKNITQEVADFKTAHIPEELPFVYIDAYHCSVKDTRDEKTDTTGIVKEASIYTVIGLDFEAKKRVLGFYVEFGNENKGTWIKIFNDLVQRHLKRVMMFISDDFSGISDAIHSVYPAAMTQKCIIHFLRNIDRNLSPKIATEFKQKIRNIRDDASLNFDEAVNKFENLCRLYENENKTFFKYVLNKKQEYWIFMKFDSEIRKYINTSNIVENFNSVLEKSRVAIGGYFQSINVAEKSIYLIVRRLHNNVWNRPIPKLKHFQHDVRQKFNLTFGENYDILLS